eukprot:Tbor_TRINITY_DN5899_c3_g1::TRINITY_DN5899_c3_g1_i1::g.6562::m.6562/K19681/IFT52; intraflagellar transport protein 52
MAELGTRDEQPKICFNCCKKEQLLPNKGLKTFHRKLKQYCIVNMNKEEVTTEKLMPHDLVVFGSPSEPLTENEIKAISNFIEAGGSCLITLGDGQGGKYSKMSPILEKYFGIGLNEDCVVRTVLHKYFHPKEVAVTHGVTNREISRLCGKNVVGAVVPSGSIPNHYGKEEAADTVTSGSTGASTLSFVYPYGLTLNVQRPSYPILSSGFMAFPLNRPICAVWEASEAADHNGKVKRGKLMVIGSGLILEDQWITKEENDKLVTVLVDYLLHKVKMNQIDADEPDVTDYHHLPDTGALSQKLRVAVEESEDLPRDFTKLFDFSTFKLDTSKIPEVSATYQKLQVKQEPLTLIPPEFQTPLPPCLPATFDPTHRDPPTPALDLFDLDEHFAPERVRLAQLTNKCHTIEDLELFITGASEIIGVTKKLHSPRNKDPKALLDHIFRQIVQYKKQNQHGGGNGETGAHISMADRNTISSSGGNEAMIRVIRVFCDGSGSNESVPFDDNAPWTLILQANFGRNVISGTLSLTHGSHILPPQQIQVEGQIYAPGVRELPLEWGFLASGHTGDQIPYVFYGKLNGNALSGTCECPSSGQTWDFMYLTSE